MLHVYASTFSTSFLYHVLILIIEPPHKKANNLHMQKQSADQLHSNWEADQHLCFHYMDSITNLNLKFPASSNLLCLYSPVCVGPGWFCHAKAQFMMRNFARKVAVL